MHKVVHILACGKSGGIETLVAEYAKKSSHNNYLYLCGKMDIMSNKLESAAVIHIF